MERMFYSERRKPMSFNSLTPNLMVQNVRDSSAWYQRVMGFAQVSEVASEEDPEVLNFAIMVRDSVTIMLQAAPSFHHDVPGTSDMPVGASLTFYTDVTDFEATVEAVRPHVTLVKDVHQTWYGATEFYFRDMNGYIWCFTKGQSG
jgi:uncharacterized glyoxalase superfamily protein PhnB